MDIVQCLYISKNHVPSVKTRTQIDLNRTCFFLIIKIMIFFNPDVRYRRCDDVKILVDMKVGYRRCINVKYRRCFNVRYQRCDDVELLVNMKVESTSDINVVSTSCINVVSML